MELFAARQAYHIRYQKSLEEDVAYHTSGDFRKVNKLFIPLFACDLIH